MAGAQGDSDYQAHSHDTRTSPASPTERQTSSSTRQASENSSRDAQTEVIDTTAFIAMVRAMDGVTLYFDSAEIAQYQFLGYTDAQKPVYRLFYKNGTMEDMIDMYSVLSQDH